VLAIAGLRRNGAAGQARVRAAHTHGVDDGFEYRAVGRFQALVVERGVRRAARGLKIGADIDDERQQVLCVERAAVVPLREDTPVAQLDSDGIGDVHRVRHDTIDP
jgi:hypothetical protein